MHALRAGNRTPTATAEAILAVGRHHFVPRDLLLRESIEVACTTVAAPPKRLVIVAFDGKSRSVLRVD